MIDRRPAIIVRPAGVSDVVKAVDFARQHRLPIAVRGGGHNVAGHATCDDGLLIDFRLMKGVRVDPGGRTVRAEAGCSWIDFDPECQVHGLATTGGTVGSTGIAGLTLGGGIGHLMGSYGLTCDNLLSVDLVTVDGQLLVASEDENSELFWGLRGGGGNFGIVTSFEFRLHPVGTLYGGYAFYPWASARAALELYREMTASAPDELGLSFVLLTSPDTGEKLAMISACYNGDAATGEAAVAPMRTLDSVHIDLGPKSYAQIQAIFAEIPFGLRHYWKGTFLPAMEDAAIDATIDRFDAVQSPLSVVLIEAPHGAASRVADDAMAYGQRQARYNLSAFSIWTDESDDARQIEWARAYASDLQPLAGPSGAYVNYLGHDEPTDRIRSAFGPAKYERLLALKRAYDPDNVLRFNQNIRPDA
jgi:FAD/FMN-containing dehydrogenase